MSNEALLATHAIPAYDHGERFCDGHRESSYSPRLWRSGARSKLQLHFAKRTGGAVWQLCFERNISQNELVARWVIVA
jgi:hypothetical protein